MPAAKDFRAVPVFAVKNVHDSGRDVGSRVFWKLYAIENLVRVIVHSVLSAQIGTAWWATAVDPGIQKKAQGFKAKYQSKPWHGNPGSHDIYYIDLADLNEIIRANSNLFLPIVADIDQWMARIEQVRLPRNIVAHMNWPNTTDRQRIDVFHSDLQALSGTVSAKVSLVAP